MTNDLAIRVADVWKRYGLPLRPWIRRQADRLQGASQSGLAEYGPWALRDISFEVGQGESLGIVGKNGAGKSTLLKLLAGVSPATHGKVEVFGRLFPMIELAAGMHRELTGRENIRLLGTIMGFTARQMTAKMPAIEDFAELGDWLEKPVWQYSSGMQARLGFSVAVNVDADILLIDEVLSVGDVNFRKKCLTRMDKLSSSGVTIIFVTHNPYAIERLCDRAIYLRDGTIVASGSTSDILNAYHHQSIDKSTDFSSGNVNGADLRQGTGSFRITRVDMLDAVTSLPIDSFHTGDSVKFSIDLSVREPVESYSFSIRILDPAGTIMSFIDIPSSTRAEVALGKDSRLECTIENINLLPGEFYIDLVAKELAGPVIDSIPVAFSFAVTGDSEIMQRTENRGLIYLPADWRLVASESQRSGETDPLESGSGDK